MIKIKLGLVGSDRLYLERFMEFAGKRYGGRTELYSFTEPESALQSVAENRIDVLAALQDTDIAPDRIPEHCVFVYLTDSGEIDRYNGCRTVFRYQRAELVYKAVTGLYTDRISDRIEYRTGSGNSHITLFLPECEGSGTATAAAAFSEYSARSGRKTLFLNLRQFRETEDLISAPGDSTFTDVIFSLKSRKSRLRFSLENAVRKSRSGVYFFGSCRNSTDIAEISAAELKMLIDELREEYENIVIVSDFYISERMMLLSEQADSLIIVSGAGRDSEKRLRLKREALECLEKRNGTDITGKLQVLYNRAEKPLPVDIPAAGVFPDRGECSSRTVMAELVSSGIFGELCGGEAV